jgi:hypothetical protein
MYASNGAIYAAGADGGVWLSKIVNNTRQWSPLDMGIPTNIAVNSLAVVAPDSNTNDDILYAGTGEGYFTDDAVQGNGIYKDLCRVRSK